MGHIAEDLLDHSSVEDVKSQVAQVAVENDAEAVRFYSFMDGSRIEVRAQPGQEATAKAFDPPPRAET